MLAARCWPGWCAIAFVLLGTVSANTASYRPRANGPSSGDEVFTNNVGVRHLQIEISDSNIQTLRRYSFRARDESSRTNVPATVREGERVWTNVAVHIKGALGSFRPIDNQPSLTLNFDKWVEDQTFHGLEKISLNNSVQDPSYLNEKISRELYRAAGVITPRADFATVELNGRYLGLYVLTEGWNKQFLRRYFDDVSGNFYDFGGKSDVTNRGEASSGKKPTEHPALLAVTAAVNETNHARRIERMRETIDLDRFVSLLVLDCLMWNWDGYAMNRNNFRMFHDREEGKLVFFPHGVDQMFWKPNGPIMTGRSGIASRALLETQEGRELYLARLREIRSAIYDPRAITNRITQETARIRPALLKSGVAALAQHEAMERQLRNAITARARDVDQQLAGVQRLLPLESGEHAVLTNWAEQPNFGSVVMNRTADKKALRIAISRETSFGAWSSKVWLSEGRYVVEGRVKTTGVAGRLRNEPGGAGFRIWSERKETRGASWGWFPYSSSRDRQLGGLIPPVSGDPQRLAGDHDWTLVAYEFELRQPLADLHVQCVLQGQAGEAQFDIDSLRIRRVSATVTKAAPGTRGE